ncbi:MAG: hypothetical protein HYV01_22060 [Deltaproteobacteria bacterium]|nr:hypothetical protein [Deltaproteobacteria bacterium]
MKNERKFRLRWQALGSIFVVGVVVNYVWELAQAPLYVGMENYSIAVLRHCFVASLGDGLMVLLITAVGWLVLRHQNWFAHPGVAGYLVMLTTGFLLAVLVEWVGVYVLGRWQYTETMPVVPGLGVGVVPIAQMVVLPPLIFRMAAALGMRRGS